MTVRTIWLTNEFSLSNQAATLTSYSLSFILHTSVCVPSNKNAYVIPTIFENALPCDLEQQGAGSDRQDTAYMTRWNSRTRRNARLPKASASQSLKPPIRCESKNPETLIAQRFGIRWSELTQIRTSCTM